MYIDFKSDESYTPNRISIKAGTIFQDLKEILYIDLKEPSGWYMFPLRAKLSSGVQKKFIKTMNL